MSQDVIEQKSPAFDNGNTATVILTPKDANASEIVSSLDNIVPYKKVILILGGADESDVNDKNKLAQLFGLGIAKAAVEASAVIIDAGTNKGITAMMGEGVAARGYKTSLIGIAPKNVVADIETNPDWSSLEPNHSHFILIPGDKRGNVTSTIFKLQQELSNPATLEVGNGKKQALLKTKSNKVPAIAILSGGGVIARNEVLRAVRQNIPVIVIKGSGGFADEIVTALERKDPLKEEPLMAEIISDGKLHFHDLSKPVKGVERLIIRELGIDNVLMQAWETFALYDHNANLQQKNFDFMQLSILFLGVFSTFLVIYQQVFAPPDPKTASNLLAPGELWRQKFYFWWVLHYILIFIPILLTVMVTAVNRFKQGPKWLLLRAGAESIKREIFRYRTRAMYYNEKPEQQLAQRIEDITRRTMRTDVNSSSLKPYNKDRKDKTLPPEIFSDEGDGKDDGFSYLVPDRYITIRLNDQADFYGHKAIKLERQTNILYWLTFIIGGLGTFLAAIGLEVWIAVTTSLVGAFVTFLGYKQTERTLMKYNQSATDLSNVRAWWNALSGEEQAAQKNIDSLVEHTEQVLQSELDGWIQQMQNALAELRDSQKKFDGPKGSQNDEPLNRSQNGEFSRSATPPKPKDEMAGSGSESPGIKGETEGLINAEVEENRQPIERNIGKDIASIEEPNEKVGDDGLLEPTDEPEKMPTDDETATDVEISEQDEQQKQKVVEPI